MEIISDQPKRIHSSEFLLYVAIGSICMMFAGLTSAYLVKKNLGNWVSFPLPTAFIYSTFFILTSSITLQFTKYFFNKKSSFLSLYCLTYSLLAGILFLILQIDGFKTVHESGLNYIGANSTISATFLLVLAGLHLLHALVGCVCLAILTIRFFWFRHATDTQILERLGLKLKMNSIYWHFVDILWIYIYIFLIYIR